MAQTTAGALKVAIESLGLGISAYRDQAPAGLDLPYVVVQEAIAVTPDALEDGRLTSGAEQVQIDVYERLGEENYALMPGLRVGLHGTRLAKIGNSVVYVVLVRNETRVVDLQMTQVRHIIQADVLREL